MQTTTNQKNRQLAHWCSPIYEKKGGWHIYRRSKLLGELVVLEKEEEARRLWWFRGSLRLSWRTGRGWSGAGRGGAR